MKTKQTITGIKYNMLKNLLLSLQKKIVNCAKKTQRKIAHHIYI